MKQVCRIAPRTACARRNAAGSPKPVVRSTRLPRLAGIRPFPRSAAIPRRSIRPSGEGRDRTPAARTKTERKCLTFRVRHFLSSLYLARSMAYEVGDNFAKIVEILDARGASFVSVTQQFNTTTSMGRLTLNVLLSFAQFEREVIGERIRDKIAASKRKGMWMGGVPPLGYRVEHRKLVVVDSEAETVRSIFRRYTDLGSVRLLKEEIDTRGIKSKSWTSASGRRIGAKPFSRGALYLLLQNRTYLGEIVHKGQSHRGEHAPIIDQPLWDTVRRYAETWPPTPPTIARHCRRQCPRYRARFHSGAEARQSRGRADRGCPSSNRCARSIAPRRRSPRPGRGRG